MRCIDLPRRNRDFTLYDAIVTGWNKLKPFERQARESVCKTKGHDWAPLSFGPNVCRRCLRYYTSEE